MRTLIKEPPYFSGSKNQLLEIIFPLTDNRIKNESGLRMHFAKVLRQFHEYVISLDELFSTIVDEKSYFYFLIDEKRDFKGIIAMGHIYHRFAVPSSDNKFKKLKGGIVFFSDGQAELFYYQEEETEEGFFFKKISKIGAWKEVFREFLSAIIINFEICAHIYPETFEITEQEIKKLRQAIDYLD